MLDILIKNGVIIDGTGKPPFKAEVGVSEGRIVLVSAEIAQQATQTIDASGLHVAPGFIDPHTHSELTLLVNPKAESKIRQGVTTEIVGNCGGSPGPLIGASMEEEKAGAEILGVDVDWTSLGGYLDRVKRQGSALNVVTLVGHNTIRGAVLGFDDVQPSSAQQAEMEHLMAEAMEQGACGLSTGLFYPPGYYAHTEEVIGLARVAAKYGGIYASHIRSETDRLFEAVEEAIDIGDKAGIPVQVSHIKLEGYRNWGGLDQLVALLEGAGSQGVHLRCDQYPYDAGLSWLAYILPYWAQAGGALEVAQRLRDPEVRSRLREDWKANRSQWEERGGMKEWSDLMITACHTRPEVQGETVAEIALEDGKDPFETALDLIVISEGQVECVCFGQLEGNVRALMQHPLVVVGSDGESLAPYGILAQSGTHPRSYGTFPRVLGHYVREEKVLSLESAVKKMSFDAARQFGLTDRGVIKKGAWADLVLFDDSTVNDLATYTAPHSYPEGIPYVIVNGVKVIDQGVHTDALPGKVL
ncbi:MAG: D-aminoacylase [Anaerolineales bacterium]